MTKILKLPFIGGSRERAAVSFPLPPLPSKPTSEEHREAVIGIWAVGKTPIDEVRMQLARQFTSLDEKDITDMVNAVEVKRKIREESRVKNLPEGSNLAHDDISRFESDGGLSPRRKEEAV